jgi:hypothetical protein
MPKVSKKSAKRNLEKGPVSDRGDEFLGFSISFVEFREDVDGTPLMKGLPDDRCQCAHWGYVVKGKMTYRYADRDEVYEAGDAYYAPPGHVPVKHEPGTEIVMFSPAAELKKTEDAMDRNMASLMGSHPHQH